jgi:hypothetical protein
LEKYNKLDEFGKHTINVVLEMEFNRCNKWFGGIWNENRHKYEWGNKYI